MGEPLAKLNAWQLTNGHHFHDQQITRKIKTPHRVTPLHAPP